MPDVLVSGGGPTGPMVAFELERAGLDVLVLERDARPTPQPDPDAAAVREIGTGLLAVPDARRAVRYGYVAWAGGPGLATALDRWFGPRSIDATQALL